MVTEADKEWLTTHHPTLQVDDSGMEIKGEFVFSGAYDKLSNTFTPLTLQGQTALGVILSGSYNIVITLSTDKNFLPKLKVLDEKITSDIDRHFYTDPVGKACLCGPTEEIDFLNRSNYSLPMFIEELVTPFLYGQRFYDEQESWPWDEYLHGAAGAFHSFYDSQQTVEHAKACIRKLKKTKHAWERVERILFRGEMVDGGSKCFCGSHKIKDCNMKAWEGFRKLRRMIAENNITH